MKDYDPGEEYSLMEKSGMSPRAILGSLTTAPAALFGESRLRGIIREGMNADLVVFEDDPLVDIKNFGNVVYNVRNGKVIFSARKS
jgi:imidazolonepropionase-like amidohydrolase